MLQPKLRSLLQLAYSAERVAAHVFQAHVKVVKTEKERLSILQIEQDEWAQRTAILKIMQLHSVPISKWNEVKFAFIGRLISWSSIFIGWFISTYFAALIESNNVNEYFAMKKVFNAEAIHDYDNLMIELGMKEKEEQFF